MHLVYSIIRSIFKIKDKIVKIIYININKCIFKSNGVNYGKNLTVYNHFYLKKHPSSKLCIGDNFKFTSGDAINPLCRNLKGCIYLSEASSQLLIGDNVGISSACIRVKDSITIKDRVLIGGDTIIMDTDAHNLDYKIRSLRNENSNSTINKNKAKELNIPLKLLNERTIDSLTANSSPIVIEKDVLIGTRCIILKGVTIGERSIIGSGSIVTKSIPSDCIAAGNPAKIIKYMTKDE